MKLKKVFLSSIIKVLLPGKYPEREKEMKQAVMVAPGKIEFREVQKPEIGEHEVLLLTKRIGICGSDIHVYHGLHPYTSYPVVQGHEVSGIAAKVARRLKR